MSPLTKPPAVINNYAECMAWTTPIGQVLRRTEVHRLYGGQQQGGISTPKASRDILLFSSKSGRLYGYNFDGWRSHDSFHYTGEGQTGDQMMIRGNLAVLKHHASGCVLRLFTEVARSTVRYDGAFRVDRNDRYHRDDAPSRESHELRSVIVFHLVPVDGDQQSPGQPAESTAGPRDESTGEVPLEEHVAERFVVRHRDELTSAERLEARLVKQYADWLTAKGHTVKRNKIPLVHSDRWLYTDLFDVTTQELVEAKGSVARPYIRLGLGQILDYVRSVPHKTRALLVPVEPPDDLVSLLADHQIACIYPSDADFVRIDPR